MARTPSSIGKLPSAAVRLVTVSRKLNGRRVSQGGRDHTSHRLVALGISIYGLIKQSATASLEIQLPYLIAAGGGMTIAAIIAMIRSMSVFDILEAMLDAVFLLFAMIGAVLKGIWNAILGLFGWD